MSPCTVCWPGTVLVPAAAPQQRPTTIWETELATGRGSAGAEELPQLSALGSRRRQVVIKNNRESTGNQQDIGVVCTLLKSLEGFLC